MDLGYWGKVFCLFIFGSCEIVSIEESVRLFLFRKQSYGETVLRRHNMTAIYKVRANVLFPVELASHMTL